MFLEAFGLLGTLWNVLGRFGMFWDVLGHIMKSCYIWYIFEVFWLCFRTFWDIWDVFGCLGLFLRKFLDHKFPKLAKRSRKEESDLLVTVPEAQSLCHNWCYGTQNMGTRNLEDLL